MHPYSSLDVGCIGRTAGGCFTTRTQPCTVGVIQSSSRYDNLHFQHTKHQLSVWVRSAHTHYVRHLSCGNGQYVCDRAHTHTWLLILPTVLSE
jgi:hypothetical protein